MLSGIKTIWKVGAAAGAALLGISVGGAVYDKRKCAAIDDFDDDDFEDVEEADAEVVAEEA
jgi:hypothetical protein